MERIDINLFKTQSKFKVIVGKLIKQDNILESKDILFNNLSVEDAKKIKGNYKTNGDMFFDFIPILSNVDMTISKDEFLEMYNNPTPVFEDFLMNFIEHIQDIIFVKSKAINIENKFDKIIKESGIDLDKIKKLQELEQQKAKEDIEKELQKLYENIKTDKENRGNILERIDILEKQLNEMSVDYND